MDLKQSDGWRYLAGWSFILLMVASATLQHDAEIILPEIGALTAGTWVYRKTAWTRQPLKLFLVPSGTAIIGFLSQSTTLVVRPQSACRSITDAIIIEGVKIEFGASLCYWLTANYH